MSSKPEPAIWSRDTGQQISYYDSCQLNIIWMSNKKDIHCNPRLQGLVLAGWPPCCATSFVVVVVSHFYHEKRVAWVSISMHECDPVPIVMGLRLATGALLLTELSPTDKWNIEAYTDTQAEFCFSFVLFAHLFVVKQQTNILLDRQIFHILFCSFQGFFQKVYISGSLKERKQWSLTFYPRWISSLIIHQIFLLTQGWLNRSHDWISPS